MNIRIETEWAASLFPTAAIARLAHTVRSSAFAPMRRSAPHRENSGVTPERTGLLLRRRPRTRSKRRTPVAGCARLGKLKWPKYEGATLSQEYARIRWRYAVEYVPLKGIARATKKIETSECWSTVAGTPTVTYIVRVEAFSRHGTTNTLRLRYDRKDQRDQRVINADNDVSFGSSEITWDTSSRYASAYWIEEGETKDGPNSGAAKSVKLLSNGSPFIHLRKEVSVITKTRPGQQELRQLLLIRDRACVLSGETEQTALDAAHIVPVKAGGQEVQGNAILLRADLHRLFDKGLFCFDVSGRGSVIRCSKSLSKNYIELLSKAALSQDTFEVVREALRARAILPGGKLGKHDTV